MPKTLRITFSGICTRAPGYPRDEEQEPEKVYVLMPAAREEAQVRGPDGGPLTISRHHAFIYAPAAHLESFPEPAFSVDDEKLGLCHVYQIDHARVTIDPPPLNGIEHYVTRRPLVDRPGARNEAPEDDVRWLADMRDIVPDHARLHAASDPRRRDLGDHVAMVVELPGGRIKANFPCKTVQVQEFRPAPDPPIRRAIATEFIAELEYADTTSDVRLQVGSLVSAVVGFAAPALTIRMNRPVVDIRIGNDTFDEIMALQSIKRCNSRPSPVAHDNDFNLHYKLLDIPPDRDRPLPFNGSHQTQHNGCAGASAQLGGTS